MFLIGRLNNIEYNKLCISILYGGGISMPYLQIANYGIITDMCK